MIKLYNQFLYTILIIVIISCNNNEKPSSIVGENITKNQITSVPDTIRRMAGPSMYDFYGIISRDGVAQYLITKPYNPHGFILIVEDGIIGEPAIVTEILRLKLVISEEYQKKANKFPSFDSFSKDENSTVLYQTIYDCIDIDPTKICDCTSLKIE